MNRRKSKQVGATYGEIMAYFNGLSGSRTAAKLLEKTRPSIASSNRTSPIGSSPFIRTLELLKR